MRPLRLLLPLFVLLPLCVGPLRADARGSTAVRGTLAQRLTAKLRKAGVRPGSYGVVVLTRSRVPRVIFAVGHDEPLVPASAAKVLTAAAALDLLGPSHVFRPRITARGGVRDGVLEGDLVLHGAGDPSLSGRFHDGQPFAVPAALADAVARAGIRRVRGALVLDEGLLDREFVHAEWSAADKRRWYGAPVGGLSFNDNCVDVVVRGGTGAGAAAVDLPAGAGPWTVRNLVRTEPRSSAAVGGRWIEDGRVLELHGRVPPGGRASFNVPVQDPALFLGGAMLRSLASAGVRVDGGLRRPRDEADAAGGEPVAEHDGELPPALEVMNQNSQNFYASLLFKLAGAALDGRGTWESGGRAVEAMLARRGIVDRGTTDMRDGSGLSPRNRVTAGVMVQVLQAFDQDPLRGPLLLASLPVSGESGTLRNRLPSLRGRVHAKTGTLNDTRARALVGYLDAQGASPGYVFAILLNGGGASHTLADELVLELAR